MKISRIETIHLGDIPHDVGSLVELRRCTSTPLLASEYLMTRYEYRPLLEARGADIVMIDPTWTGGVTESVVIQDGHILAPTAPGLGTALLPDLARRPDATLVESVPT